MYKIFINDKPFILCKPEEAATFSADLEVLMHPNPTMHMDWIRAIESAQHKGTCVICDEPAVLFENVKANFKTIQAAGGLVFNDHNQVLLIKRLGLWDLPKGKIDQGENKYESAIREVEEECGMKELSILHEYPCSFHTYKLQGHRFLKQTFWFKMHSSFSGKLVPQTEENITEVKWVDWDTLNPMSLDTYQSIREVLLAAKNAN
jgi:8-oxo-dGTP pyrophosphatase MutT (NUDIX family)